MGKIISKIVFYFILTSCFLIYHQVYAQPYAITNLSALTGNYENEVRLTWTYPGPDILPVGSKYLIQHSSYNVVWSTTDAQIDISTACLPMTDHNRTITGLTKGATYYFRIWTSSGTQEIISNVSNGATTWAQHDVTSPGIVTGFTGVTGAQIQLSWVAPGDNGYSGDVNNGAWEIKYSSDINTSPETAENIINKTNISWIQGNTYSEIITGLKPRTTYYFWIRTRDENINNWSIWSDTETLISGSLHISWSLSSSAATDSIAWGDYDNDGDLDLAVGCGGVNRVYRCNEDGTFTTAWTSIAELTKSIAWGDYDNDGDLDLAVGNYNGTNRVYRNNGDETFSSIWNSEELEETKSIAWGDYDNDGDLDLAVGNNNQVNRIYENNKTSFTNVWNSVELEETDSIAWGDYDNDGDLDLAAGNYLNKNRVYRNDGNGTFISIWSSVRMEATASIAWGDYDNDGDLDLAVGNFNDTNRVYRNNGDETFTSIWNSVEEDETKSVSWGDYDNDGDLDLAVGNCYVQNRIYENNNGSFAIVWNLLDTESAASISWGDYDNDGDLDLAAGNWQPTDRIYKSLDADFGNVNTTPTTPSTGFSSIFNHSTGILEFRWNHGTDIETNEEKGLYYCIRIATEPISDNLKKWIVSPSTGLGATPFLGNYPHGFVVGTSTQPGFNLKPPIENVTYYWQVRTIDTGLHSSDWATQQSIYICIPPASVTDLKAIQVTSEGEVKLVWTAPGDDGIFGNITDGKYWIKYSSVPNHIWSDMIYETIYSTSIVSGNSESKLITNLLSGVSYYFYIKTCDEIENNWSALSNKATFWIQYDLTPPGMITGFTAITGSQIELQWIAPGDDGYIGNLTNGMWQIVYSSTIGSTYETAEYVIEKSSVNWIQGDTYFETITGIKPRTTYYFWIRVRDENVDNWSIWSDTKTAVSGSFVDIEAGIIDVMHCSLSWGDYDNDGDLDLALAGSPPSGLQITRIYRNDNGNFIDISAGLVNMRSASLTWGDYDNDGDLDLTVSGSDSFLNYYSKIYQNNNGIFTDINAGLIGVDQGSLSWGDYDNDGDLDLALAGSGPVSRIYRNNDGIFNDINAGLINVYDCSLVWGDYDNDGDLDLALAGWSDVPSITSKIYRNDNGSFVDINAGLTGAYEGSFSWGDYDNDGDLDLALTGGSSGGGRIAKIYRNDNNSFIDIQADLIGVTDTISSLSWGDYDNDGDLDLIYAGDSGSEKITKIYRNDNGSFIESIIELPGVDYASLALGDYDNDGDLDLALAGRSNSGRIAKIYKSFEADFGNVNTRPNAPSTNITSIYNPTTERIELRWDYGLDIETSQKGLYYDVRMATELINNNLGKWVVSPSTGAGVGYCPSQTIGNYPHGFISSSTQPGFNLIPQSETTYYWQVRTIDTGLRTSAWSVQQSVYVPDNVPPRAVTDLVARSSYTVEGRIVLNWTAPYEDGSFGGSVSEYLIKYDTFSIDSLLGDTTAWWNSAKGSFQRSFPLPKNPSETETEVFNYSQIYPGTTYYFAIISYDDALPEPLSSLIDVNAATPGQQAWAFAPDYPPTTPEGLGVVGYTALSITLTWNDLMPVEKTLDFDKYLIYRSSTGVDGKFEDGGSYVLVGSTVTTEFTDNISVGNTYYYCISAIDLPSTILESELSPAVTQYVSGIDVWSPAPVTDLVAAANTGAGLVGEGKIDLTWTAPHEDGLFGGDVSGYWIKYTTFSVASFSGDTTAWWNLAEGPIEKIGGTTPGDSDTFQASCPDILPNVTYYFAIKSYDDEMLISLIDMKASTGNQAYAFARDDMPNKPIGLTILETTTSYVQLSWTDSSPAAKTIDFDFYRIYRSTTELTGYRGIDFSISSQYIDMSVVIDTTYYYKISAVDKPPRLESPLSDTALTYVPPTFISPQIYSISGYIEDINSKAIINVKVSLSGAISGTYYTDLNGYYEFDNLYEGNYTITAKKSGWTFNPTEIDYSMLDSNMINQNFVGTYTTGEHTLIDIPIGENNQPVTISLPTSGDMKIIAPERAKARRGVINPDKDDEVPIIFKSDKPAGESVGQIYKIRIFNLLGELVDEFEKIPQTPDDTWTTWKPKDLGLSSGIYIIHIQGHGVNIHKKIPILR